VTGTNAVNAAAADFQVREIPVLLGGDPVALKDWAASWQTRRVLGYVVVIFAGAGMYGAAMGYWRSPVQAGYNLVKFPLIVLATTLGNALLNGMLAPLLGLDLRFRQSLMLVVMSFTIAAAILGSFAPIVFFIVWNIPPLANGMQVPSPTYSFVLLLQVVLVAFAGVAANVRLQRLLGALSGSDRIARKVLFSWLAGNLFLGSQLCWIFRPLIGSPGLPVEFVRPNAFQGNFYEAVFRAIGQLFSS